MVFFVFGLMSLVSSSRLDLVQGIKDDKGRNNRVGKYFVGVSAQGICVFIFQIQSHFNAASKIPDNLDGDLDGDDDDGVLLLYDGRSHHGQLQEKEGGHRHIRRAH